MSKLKHDRGDKALHGFFKFMEGKLADKLLPWRGWEEVPQQVCPLSGKAVKFDYAYPTQIHDEMLEFACDGFGRKVAYKVGDEGAECYTVRNGQAVPLLGCYCQGAWCYGTRWDSGKVTIWPA